MKAHSEEIYGKWT